MSAADFQWREYVTHAKLADEYVSKATRRSRVPTVTQLHQAVLFFPLGGTYSTYIQSVMHEGTVYAATSAGNLIE